MRILVGIIALFAAAHVASADPCQAVLKRYASWRGGIAFSSLKTIEESGNFADGGLQGRASRYASVGGDVRAESQYGPFTTTLAVLQGSGAYTDLAGQRLPLSPLEVLYAQIDAQLLLLPPAKECGAVSLRPPEKSGGKIWAVVEVNRGMGGHYDYLIAPKTGELFGVRAHRNGSTSMEIYSDWRVVNGVRLPFHVHVSGDAGLGALQNDTTDFNVATVELNRNPPIQTLDPPPNRNVASFASAGEASGWIGFHSSDHAIFLDVTLNGHKVSALLDSGASQTAIDQTFARSNGIAAVGTFKTGGQGGSISTAYAPGLTIQTGDVTLDGVVANLIDFDQPGTRMSPPLVAILGAEVFAETALEIDYAAHRLRFLRPELAPKLENGVTVPLGLFEGSFHFPVSIEGQTAIPILLDTGNEGSFQLFPAYWQPRKMLKSRPSTLSGNGGVGGLVSFRLAQLTAIDIGTIRLTDVPTTFEMPGNSVNNETGILGNLGDALLEKFHVIINFPKREISFKPAEALADASKN